VCVCVCVLGCYNNGLFVNVSYHFQICYVCQENGYCPLAQYFITWNCIKRMELSPTDTDTGTETDSDEYEYYSSGSEGCET
jgi:hypothetical protein